MLKHNDHQQVIQTKKMLEEWACYRIRSHGFRSSSSITMIGQAKGAASKSQLPTGAEASDRVYIIINILNVLKKEGWTKEVMILEKWYLKSYQTSADDIALSLKLSRTKLYLLLNEAILAVAHRYFSIERHKSGSGF